MSEERQVVVDHEETAGENLSDTKVRHRSRSPLGSHFEEKGPRGYEKERGGGFYRERDSSSGVRSSDRADPERERRQWNDSRSSDRDPERDRRQWNDSRPKQWGRNRGHQNHPGRRSNRGPEPQDSLDILAELSNESKSHVQKNLKLTFDFYTPRAHLVILGRQRGRWRDYTDMDPDVQKELIQIVQGAIDMLTLDEATLAIHRGAWVTTKDNFHAHICTDVETYLKIYGDLSVKSPMADWWPSRRFVTRQWKASSDPKEYPANVRGYPFRTYKNEEIREILTWKEHNKDILSPAKESETETRNQLNNADCQSDHADTESLSSESKEEHTTTHNDEEKDTDGKDTSDLKKESSQGETILFRGRSIVYHMSKRRIGVAGPVECNVESLLEFVKLLDDLAGSIGAKTLKEGCHVCVDITCKGFADFPTKEPVMGYLQVSGPVIYRNCPHKQREVWLENYITSDDDKVYT